MPIAQDRLVALLAEAEDWKTHAELLQRSMLDAATELAQNLAAMAQGEFAAMVEQLRASATAQGPSAAAIMVERYHQRKFGKRNDRIRAKRAAERGAIDHGGTLNKPASRLNYNTTQSTPRATAPQSAPQPTPERIANAKQTDAEQFGADPFAPQSATSNAQGNELLDTPEERAAYAEFLKGKATP